jgi:hypothetical protein
VNDGEPRTPGSHVHFFRGPLSLAPLVLLCASFVASYYASMYYVSVETWSDKASRAFSRQNYCPVSRVSVVPRYCRRSGCDQRGLFYCRHYREQPIPRDR